MIPGENLTKIIRTERFYAILVEAATAKLPNYQEIIPMNSFT